MQTQSVDQGGWLIQNDKRLTLIGVVSAMGRFGSGHSLHCNLAA